MKDAPTADINEWGTLVCLAEAADEDGCNAFPSVKTMAAYAKISTRTVQRALAAMEERKLIAEGDQRAAQYIPEHRRPTVYDLLVPYDWFRDIERTNAFRMRLGRSPLTRTDRPPIAPAPPKKTRADKGRPKPKKAAKDAAPEGEPGGRLEVTPVENAPSEGGRLEVTRVENPDQGATTSQGVTTSPERGDFKSEGGRLEVTQPTPTTRTTDQPLPSVGSSGSASATEDGGTDGSALDVRTQKERARTVERTPGVDLLLAVGKQRPELLLTGKVLADQGRTVDGLLLADWPRDLILSALLRPLPAETRSVSAVLAKRLSDLLMTPLPRHMAMPAPRSPESADGYWDRYEEAKRASVWQPDPMAAGEDVHDMVLRRTRFADCSECRDPIVTPTGTDLCVKCAGWPQCPVCTKYVQPNTSCEACEVRPDEVEFELCEEHGARFIAGTACFECVGPTA
ncbi:helix-turn-helix domain-containing protein [Streptomyces ardesiacus]|uniref:helix-turn-helix domain-containing protein n=1 Tax=Streptomyces ardesiacus TaxID=285564 RepID=UPI000D59098A|nr:helix-turn-helix domain-containing protein [Streptomyces ardesiacus]